ncbi:phage integrase SAM-like domain-containing protein [Peijinzhouia sedimentorum]
MAKFTLYLREPKAEKESPIQLVIWHQNKQLKISTGKSIHPRFWNKAEQQARLVKDFPQGKIFNQILDYIKESAKKCLIDIEKELQRPPTAKELKEEIIKAINPDAPQPNSESATKPKFMELFARFIKESETGERLKDTGERFTQLTIKKYRTTETRLKEFGRKYFLDFDTIDQNFYKKFLQFLNKHNYKPNTIGKYIQVVKTFMKYATENGYNSNMSFQKSTFKVFSITGFSIYLNEEEIAELWSLDLSTDKRLEPIRDLFIVGCYTGLRYSDFSRLNEKHIEDGFFRIKTLKTAQPVIIPVHPIVEEIMTRNEGLPKAISNQKTNQYLKEVTAMVPSLQQIIEVDQVEGGQKINRKIPKWQLVTTHTARRSFATNIYKQGLMTSFDIMQITGHKTEQAFLKYIKVTPEEAAKRLQNVWRDTYLQVV